MSETPVTDTAPEDVLEEGVVEDVPQDQLAFDVGDFPGGLRSAVEAVLRAIARGLKRDRKVQISGFGAFHVRRRKPRLARNPRTGETVKVAARRTVAFRPGERLRADIDPGA